MGASAAHPLYVAAVLLPLLALAPVWVLGRLGIAPAIAATVLPAALPWTAAGALMAAAGVALAYLASPVLVDHVEAQILALGWIVAEGGRAWHGPEAAERTALLYGPLVYRLIGTTLAVADGALWAAKLPGVAGMAAFLALTYAAARRLASRADALALTGAAAAFALTLGASAFWIRPDPMIAAAAAMPLPFLLGRRGIAAALITGAALAIAVGFKAHGWLYLLPALALLARDGVRPVGLALGLGTLGALLPFLDPTMPLDDYATWLGAATTHGIDSVHFSATAQLGLFLALGALPALARSGNLERRIFALALGAALLGAVLVGGKAGAGPHHLLPLVPGVAVAAAWSRPETASGMGRWRLALFGWMLAIGLIAAATVRGDIAVPLARGEAVGAIHAEIDGFLSRPGIGLVELGYGNRGASVERYRLVLAGMPYTLDAAALMDMQRSGLPLPPATLDSIARCATPTWLIPAGQEPFRLESFYPGGGDLFGPELRALFLARYERIEILRFYDVWRCRS